MDNFLENNINADLDIVNDSLVAKWYLSIFKNNIKRAEKDTKGAKSKYAPIENIVGSIQDSIESMPENVKIDYAIAFPECSATFTEIKLTVDVLVLIKGKMHLYREIVTETIKFTETDKILSSQHMNSLQCVGSLRTYLTRYVLRSYFLNTMDGSDDPDNFDNSTEAKPVEKEVKRMEARTAVPKQTFYSAERSPAPSKLSTAEEMQERVHFFQKYGIAEQNLRDFKESKLGKTSDKLETTLPMLYRAMVADYAMLLKDVGLPIPESYSLSDIKRVADENKIKSEVFEKFCKHILRR